MLFSFCPSIAVLKHRIASRRANNIKFPPLAAALILFPPRWRGRMFLGWHADESNDGELDDWIDV